MKAEDLPSTERELIQRAIRNARPNPEDCVPPRWVLVKRLFGHGSTVSKVICARYGFDPDKEVRLTEPE